MTSLKEREAWNFKGTKICSLDEQTKKIDLAYSEVCKARLDSQQESAMLWKYNGRNVYVSRRGLKRRLDGNCIYIQGEKKCVKYFTANLGLYFIKQ
jgi:hypothetical protein